MSGPMIVSCSLGSPAFRLEAFAARRAVNSSAIGRSTMILPRRHADLTLVEERPEGRCVDRVVEIGVGQDEHRVVATELEDDSLEMTAARLGEPASGRGRAREVQAADRGVLDELVTDRGRLARRMRDDVEDTGREPRLAEDLAPEQAADDRRKLGRLQHDRVAERNRRGERAGREDQCRVPRCDRGDDADRLADSHRQRSRMVGGNDLTGREVTDRGGLPEETRHEVRLEHPHPEARTRLRGEQRDDLVATALENVRCLEEDRLALGGQALRPRRERVGRRLDRARRILSCPGRHVGDDITGERVDVVKHPSAGSVTPFTANELLDLANLWLDARHVYSSHSCRIVGTGESVRVRLPTRQDGVPPNGMQLLRPECSIRQDSALVSGTCQRRHDGGWKWEPDEEGRLDTLDAPSPSRLRSRMHNESAIS